MLKPERMLIDPNNQSLKSFASFSPSESSRIAFSAAHSQVACH